MYPMHNERKSIAAKRFIRIVVLNRSIWPTSNNLKLNPNHHPRNNFVTKKGGLKKVSQEQTSHFSMILITLNNRTLHNRKLNPNFSFHKIFFDHHFSARNSIKGIKI